MGHLDSLHLLEELYAREHEEHRFAAAIHGIKLK
jgi:hypothetical protein